MKQVTRKNARDFRQKATMNFFIFHGNGEWAWFICRWLLAHFLERFSPPKATAYSVEWQTFIEHLKGKYICLQIQN